MNKSRFLAMAAGAAICLSTATCTAFANTKATVTVQSGDSVWTIARANHLTISQLTVWNHLQNSSLIYPGQTLRLSAPTPSDDSGSSRTTDRVWQVRHFAHAQGLPAEFEVKAPQPQNTALMRAPAVNDAAASRDDIVSWAKQYIGTPYRWGGESSSGFDCSGLVQTVYAHFHIDLPRMANEQEKVGTHVSKQQLKPGDLVFFNTTGSAYSHVGIYIGADEFISATTSHGVTISSLDNPYYWGPRYTGATDPLA